MDRKERPGVDESLRWRTLFHRWFVQYNPLYLLSSALVLGGTIALSNGLVDNGGLLAQLGITAIAESYAWALIGSAALLVRIGLRRPAVMLTLLVCLYQADPTLHTETCVHLGAAGALASVAWVVNAALKLRALAWAMRVHLSRSTMLLAIGGAVGVAAIPWLVAMLDDVDAVRVLATMTFALFAFGLWSRRPIETAFRLDAWGSTVMRRLRIGIWGGWAVVWTVHLGFATSHVSAGMLYGAFLPVIGLLASRWLRTEGQVWMGVAAVVIGVLAYDPASLAWASGAAGVTLLLRAYRCPTWIPEPDTGTTPIAPWFLRAPRRAVIRLVTGAGGCAYLALWTAGWTGHPWPEPSFLAAFGVLLVSMTAARRLRSWLPASPGVLGLLHWGLGTGMVPVPRSSAQWGGVAIVSGFALLAIALAASVRFTRRRRADAFGRPIDTSTVPCEHHRSDPPQPAPQT